MALVEVSDKGWVAIHICESCGREQRVTKGQWRIVESDPEQAVFTSPPCAGCGSEQSLFAHDWIFEDSRTKEAPVHDVTFHAVAGIPLPSVSPRLVNHPILGMVQATQTETEVVMDDGHFGAKQQVLIRKVADALGRKIARRNKDPKLKYDREPQAPEPEEVRRAVAKTPDATKR